MTMLSAWIVQIDWVASHGDICVPHKMLADIIRSGEPTEKSLGFFLSCAWRVVRTVISSAIAPL